MSIRKFFKNLIGTAVDEHLAKTGKEVSVHKEVIEHHHHHHYPDGSTKPRQDGSNLTGSKSIQNVWS